VAYGDCGTGGELDRVLGEEGIERIPGAHCYEFFAGGPLFAALSEAEAGTFYLTDFLLRHFDRLVVRGLGLDRHPELFPMYFGHYRKLVYLSQAPRSNRASLPAEVTLEAALARGRAIAASMGLAFEHHPTGYGDLGASLTAAVRQGAIAWVP
jgi:hypothetical protein